VTADRAVADSPARLSDDAASQREPAKTDIISEHAALGQGALTSRVSAVETRRRCLSRGGPTLCGSNWSWSQAWDSSDAVAGSGSSEDRTSPKASTRRTGCSAWAIALELPGDCVQARRPLI